MAKNESPQKVAMREMMRSYLKDNAISIKDGTDVKKIGNTTYDVLSHYSRQSGESMNGKIISLTENDIQDMETTAGDLLKFAI